MSRDNRRLRALQRAPSPSRVPVRDSGDARSVSLAKDDARVDAMDILILTTISFRAENVAIGNPQLLRRLTMLTMRLSLSLSLSPQRLSLALSLRFFLFSIFRACHECPFFHDRGEGRNIRALRRPFEEGSGIGVTASAHTEKSSEIGCALLGRIFRNTLITNIS